MPQFRKKPVVIDSVQWNGVAFAVPLEPWLAQAAGEGRLLREGETLRIVTLEGLMTAQPGDWIICGVKGEIYPCKPDIFLETYEPVA